jgi:hypothetical protein
MERILASKDSHFGQCNSQSQKKKRVQPGPLGALTAVRLRRGQDSGLFGLRWGMKLVIKGQPERRSNGGLTMVNKSQ